MKQYKVFKFGGASVKDAAAIENLRNILLRYPEDPLAVVISAIGKTTNFLEKTLDAYYHRPEEALRLADELQRHHEQIARGLLADPETLNATMRPLFDKLRARLLTQHSNNHDFDYDQIVSFGELLSTALISEYLNQSGIANTWLDARRLMRTDSTYREGHILWDTTTAQIRDAVSRQDNRIVVTQGFIGGTAECLTTTLGREGSDFSAAVMAYALDAESVTIWKDVPGLLNADPKRFPDAVKLARIPYVEAVELSFYGASVIHPKTLKPLQNKSIPLYVKSFFRPDDEGSVITACTVSPETPSFIVKDRQTLITVSPRDFSFMDVDNLSEIFSQFSKFRVRVNMMQNSALSLSVCTGSDKIRVRQCMDALKERYKVKYNENVDLVTIRHYNQASIDRVSAGREVLLEQTSRSTTQFVMKGISAEESINSR